MTTKDLASKMWELYVSDTSRYILQNIKAYTTKNGLSLDIVERHLREEKTIGVLLGRAKLTKFLTFDVDYKEDWKAKRTTFNLVQCLLEDYYINSNHIHVSISGSKGYHVTLFFDGMIQYDELKPFYHEVLSKIDEDIHTVEFRPSGQGVKLPLSINRKTNKVCWFCDTFTLEPIPDKNYILSIEPMNLEDFKTATLDEIDPSSFVEGKDAIILTKEQGEETEALLEHIDIQGKTVDDLLLEIKNILDTNRLLYEGTRHRASYLIPIFLKEHSYTIEEAEDASLKVLLNTYDNHRSLIDKGTSREKVVNEARRLAKLVYEKDYTLGCKPKDVEITKGELLRIFQVKKLHHKKLLLSLLIHSKRHAKLEGSFYMTYSQLSKMGNTTDRGRLLKYLYELEGMELIQIVSHGELDHARTEVEGKPIRKPNVYKCLIVGDYEDEELNTRLIIKPEDSTELEDITVKLIDIEEFKKFKKAIKLPRVQSKILMEAYKKIV